MNGDVVIDPDEFRRLMSGVCAPVTIVTTAVAGRPHGATVSSFSSLSLRPPLIAVALDHGSRVLARITSAGKFGVNVLAHTQGAIATVFAQPGIDRFAHTDWCMDSGVPRLASTAGWIVCDLYNQIIAGDHLLLVGLVRSASGSHNAPLVYANRTYGTHSSFAEMPHQSQRTTVDQLT